MTKERSLLLADLAAAFTELGGLNLRGIQKGVNVFGEEGLGSQDRDHAVKEAFQGVCGDGLNVGGDGIRAKRTSDVVL
jgi:hypothetical protein